MVSISLSFLLKLKMIYEPKKVPTNRVKDQTAVVLIVGPN